jgi:prepilin-type N-terminal cleavage/methylation domain-containing protein
MLVGHLLGSYAMIQDYKTRRGFSLIELICVLVVVGVMATAYGSMRTSPKLLERTRVKQETQYLSAALHAARATAIANGAQVRLSWFKSRSLTGFATNVEGVSPDEQPPNHTFPASVKTQWSSRSVTFLPDGTTDRSLSIELASPDTTGLIELLSATGQVIVTIKE